MRLDTQHLFSRTENEDIPSVGKSFQIIPKVFAMKFRLSDFKIVGT